MNFEDRLKKGMAAVMQEKGSGTHRAQVQHDDFCPVLNRGWTCMCDPEIFIVSGKETWEIDRDGTAIKVEAKN
jgi:hypothetical protein